LHVVLQIYLFELCNARLVAANSIAADDIVDFRRSASTRSIRVGRRGDELNCRRNLHSVKRALTIFFLNTWRFA
jgi:hypothetical protein